MGDLERLWGNTPVDITEGEYTTATDDVQLSVSEIRHIFTCDWVITILRLGKDGKSCLKGTNSEIDKALREGRIQEMVDYPRAIALLRELGMETTADYWQQDMLQFLLLAAQEFYTEQLWSTAQAASSLQYLRQRGLTDESIRYWGLGYAPDGWQTTRHILHDKGYDDDALVSCGLATRNEQGRIYDSLRGRITFPLHDPAGQLVGFAGRGERPKYQNTAATSLFNKGTLLYGFSSAASAIRATGTAIIVEGYMDVIQAYQAGFTNVVAQMGTALTPQQADLLHDAPQIILALDGDDAGQTATEQALCQLGRVGRKPTIVLLPPGLDPDNAILAGTWSQALADAQPVDEWIIDRHLRNASTDDGIIVRQQQAQAALQMLLKARALDIDYRGAQLIAHRLRLPFEYVLGQARMLAAAEGVLIEGF